MKKLLGLIILSSTSFADLPIMERPNMYEDTHAQTQLLENMDHTLSNISNDMAILRGIVMECQRTSETLEIINDNLLTLLSEQQKGIKSLEFLAWHQDHKLDAKPPKKGP